MFRIAFQKKAIAIAPLLWLGAMAPARAEGVRPNIVLIMTDDQGWGDLSCHGNPVLETPHLDSLSRRGAELTRFYVCPVCSPTRASLMTGRYHFRTRVYDTYRGRSMMDPEEQTIAELLRDAGYATGIFGKWHLGDCYPMRPQDQGFDQAVVLRGGGLAQPSDPLENQGRYTNPILWRNGRQFRADGYCTDVFFSEAIAFVEAQAAAGRPFLAYITPNAPHAPLDDVPDALYRKYKAKDLAPVLLGNQSTADAVARIYAMVENIDENVGRLTAALEQRRIADNTLVIFMCDNGPSTRRYVGDRRGMKSEVLEGGVCSPFFIVWPSRIAAGAQSDRIAAHIDVLPTLLAAAGGAPPATLKLDGRNLLPLLTEKDAAWDERTLFLQAHRGTPVAGHQFAAFDQRWKLVRPSGFDRNEPPATAPIELYDMAEDRRESHNLIDDEPATAARLRADYNAWFDAVSHTRPDNFAPPRIVIGTEHEPETTLTRQDWQATDEGWGSNGHWLVRAPQPTRFRASVILEKPAVGRATLWTGEDRRDQQLTEPQQRIEFDAVSVAAGDAAIRFELSGANDSIPPYQIVLTRQAAR